MNSALNRNVDWDAFNGETYRQQYFDPISEEDAWVAQQILDAFNAFRRDDEIFKNGIDVGCGPSLVPTLASMPFVERFTLLEPGIQNINYLKAVLADQSRLEGDWKTTIELLKHSPYGVPEYQEVVRLAMEKVVVVRGRVQDMQDDSFDMFSSIFFAESATQNIKEAAELVEHTLRITKAGGLYVSAYVEHSEGWPDHSIEVDGKIKAHKFPAVDIDQRWLKERFEGTGIRVSRCRHDPMLRMGYTGILLASGRK